MLISLSLFGREIFSLEIGRRFVTVDDGSTLVHFGASTELAEENEEAAPEGRLSYGFGQQ